VAYRRPTPAINKRRHLVLEPYFTVEMLTTLRLASIDPRAGYSSKIANFAPVRGPRRNIGVRFGVGNMPEEYGQGGIFLRTADRGPCP